LKNLLMKVLIMSIPKRNVTSRSGCSVVFVIARRAAPARSAPHGAPVEDQRGLDPR